MPDLTWIFTPEDPGFLRMVAEVWGVEDLDVNFEILLSKLKILISDKENLAEVLEALPKSARKALQMLAVKGGKMPWADFSTQFGSIREMGAGRRDRLHPNLDPETPSETLYYRGFLGKVFMDEKPEPREFAFIPDEILISIQTIDPENIHLPGQPVRPGTIHHFTLASDLILQDVCTFITALRIGSTEAEVNTPPLKVEERFLRTLLKGYSILDSQGNVQAGSAKAFLEMPRAKALFRLCAFWKESAAFSDLNQVQSLLFEKECQYDPISVKSQILEILKRIPSGTWWDLSSFIEYFHSQHPNFLRPSGDFDSWYIRERETGQYLLGFESWNEIEGRLLEFLVTKPLYWFGFLDLGFSSQEGGPSCFRLSRWWKALSINQIPSIPEPPSEGVFINSRGMITVPLNTSLAARYQIGRFAKLLDSNPHVFSYQVTNESLKKAKKQGLKISQLVKIIQNHSTSPFPPMFLNTLLNWESEGPQARFASLKIIRLSNPNIVDILLKSKASKFIKESLNPTTIAFEPAGEKIIKSVLLEAGFFSEDEKEKEV